MRKANQQKQDATDSSTAGTVPENKVLHVTLPDDIHELAVFAQTHTINAVNKYKEFAESASKAYPALLEMEKWMRRSSSVIHELAVFAQTHTINAVNKYKEFAESASKAYPALLEMEKRF